MTFSTTVIRADFNTDVDVTFTVNPTVFPMFFVETTTVEGVAHTMNADEVEQFMENAFEVMYSNDEYADINVVCEQTERAHYAA